MRKKLIRTSTIPTSLENLLKGQLQMLSKYYNVFAVSSPGDDMKIIEEREGVRTIAIPMERRISLIKDFISLIRLIILFAKEKPDMVHSITPKAGLLSMLAAWITRVPVRMHTFTGLVFPTATGKMQKLLMAMDRLTCFCATYINPEGEGVKQDLINYRITTKPLHIIANGNVNGIDLVHYDRTPEVMAVAQNYISTDVFTFCFVGRMVKDKGVNELVYSFIKLYQRTQRIRLFLVGPFEKKLDPVSPDVEGLILHHPAICFMGYQADVRPYLAASDALVFPSYREGFPNVVIQAGAMGLPAIVTNINGCNEIIVQGLNGVIVPSKDEDALFHIMKRFVDNPAFVRMLAKNTRKMIADRFDRKEVWNALLEEYERLLCNV